MPKAQLEFTESRLWQHAREIMRWVYQITKRMDMKEEHLLKEQMFYTALDIPSSIAESYAKALPPDAVRKLHQARHSTFRLESLFYLGYDIQLMESNELSKLLEKTSELKMLINSRTKQFKKKSS